MKKKLFTFLLAVMASLGTMFASDTQVNGIWYNFDSSTHTATVTYQGSSYNSYSGEYTGSVVIPASVTYNNEEYSVISIGYRAFYNCKSLTSVTIPNSVTSISGDAFSYCSGLTSVTIPNSVTSIGGYAFGYCTGLTSVTIPNSVTSIVDYAFSECSGLTSIEIPNSVTYIGSSAFAGCSSLTSISVSNGNANYCSVEGVLFNKDNTVLVQYPGGKNGNYTIPNSVTSIGGYAFSECSGLTSIEIPNSVTYIGSSAFKDCTGLTSIEIPNSVTYIGSSAFKDCTGLTSVTIPNSVTNIESTAFFGCSSLTSIDIPNRVTSIGEQAFWACTGLTSVTIGYSVTNIESTAFCWCMNLTSVTNYATTPQTINANVFEGVDISSCTLYVQAESIEAYQAADVWKEFGNILPINSEPAAEHTYTVVGSSEVLFGSLWLETDVNNDMILEKGDDTFLWKKENVTLTAGNIEFKVCEDHSWTQSWPEYNYVLAIAESGVYTIQIFFNPATGIVTADATKQDSCVLASGTCGAEGDNLTWTLTCDSVLTISGTGAMADYDWYAGTPWYSVSESIKSIKIEDGVTSIGSSAFSNCFSLTTITIPNSVTSIGNNTFDGCTNMTSVEIGNNVSSIGTLAFRDCRSLTSITIPNSVTYIGYWTFNGCTGLTTIEIPNSVTNIGDGPFSECTNLSSIIAAVDNTKYCTIDGVLFSNDKTKIVQYPGAKQGAYTIPHSVTRIGGGAFYGCAGLTSVDVHNSITSIGNSAFRNCSGLTSIEIPNSVTNIGNAAFENCTGLTSITIPNSVTYIEVSAFENCTGLTSITIHNAVTILSQWAFSRCTGLTSFKNYATTPQTINADVFRTVNLSACTLYVPAESLAAYQAADVWKEFGNILAIDDSTEEVNYATLLDIYNMAADSTFTLGAFDVMYVPDFQNGSNMYIKDSTCSCVIYKVNYGLQAGDHVEAGLQGKVSIYNGLHEVIPITAKEELTITHGEAPAPMVATEVPSLNNASQYVVYEGVSFTTDTAFVEGRRHTVYGSWNGQTITFYNQYHIGATLSADKTYNITAVNTIYRTTPQAYPLAVEEVSSDTPEPCVIASGTCGAEGDNLTWTLSCDSVLTISGTGAMADYEWDGAPWYSNKESIKSVIIENGVTSIGDNAFYLCSGLTSVTIPNNVTNIGSSAFGYCSGLTSIDIPNSVTSIEFGAFRFCTGLTSVTIPNSVTSIVVSAFEGCRGLTSIDIPNSVTSIESGAFYDTGLTSVTIPNSVASIGEFVFSGCSSLTSINVSNGNANYCSVEGVLFNKDNTVLVQYPGGKNGNYTIPNSVTSIGDYAFYLCSGLTSVTIPNNVTNIGSSAFGYCSGLTSIDIPNSVTSIEFGAFRFCTGLTSVTIPNSVTSIGESAFSYCTSLTSVTIPNSVTSIGDFAFYYCSGLTSITNQATTPQAINANVFTNVNKSACTLYVPAESVEAYKAADGWKDFFNILPIEGTEEPMETVEGNYTIYYEDKDSQNLTNEVVTLHVPVAPAIDGFTFVEWWVVEGSLSLGITIQAVYEANEPTSAPEVYTNPANPAQKLIRNGNVYILTDDKIYSITGQTVR